MADKPKVAICWLGSCAGCDEAIVDLNEDILKVAGAVDLVYWPVALDFKDHHLEAMKDGEIALSIIHGSIRNSDNEHMAKLLRKKSQLVLSFGACACFGGTPGLANVISKKEIFDWVYQDSPTVVNPKGNRPQTSSEVDGNPLTLPELYEGVRPIDDVITVDYYLPGCPPQPDLVLAAVSAVVTGELPPKGSVLAPTRPMCSTCNRNATKPERLSIEQFKRVGFSQPDSEKCFLAQGFVCMGPATRGGCGETCIKINLPCRGCMGPVDDVKYFGTKFLSSLTFLLNADSQKDMEKLVDSLDDPVGTFYRFSTADSALGQWDPKAARVQKAPAKTAKAKPKAKPAKPKAKPKKAVKAKAKKAKPKKAAKPKKLKAKKSSKSRRR